MTNRAGPTVQGTQDPRDGSSRHITMSIPAKALYGDQIRRFRSVPLSSRYAASSAWEDGPLPSV